MAEVESHGTPAPECVITRCCVTCKEVKPETDFYFKDGTRIKRKESCKICVRIRVKRFAREHPDRFFSNTPEGKEAKKKRWREGYWKNPEKYRAIALKTFYKRHDKAIAHSRESYARNREKKITETVKWRKENPDRVKAWVNANRDRINVSQRKHRLKHPESGFISRANRRARKSNNPQRLSMGIRSTLMLEQKNLCPYCRCNLTTSNRHLDHVIPLSRGGRHCDENMQLTCKSCNLKKHAKDPILFGREMGIFIPSIELAI